MSQKGKSTTTERANEDSGMMSLLASLVEKLEKALARVDTLEEKYTNQQSSSKGPTVTETVGVPQLAPKLRIPRERSQAVDDDEVVTMSTESPSLTDEQHGIRANPLWMSYTAGSLKEQKPTFVLEGQEDYNVWRFAMLTFLERGGLVDFVNGEAVKPIVTAESAEDEVRLYFKWMEFDTLARTTIIASLGKNQVSFLTQCHTARDMWLRLESQYIQKTEATISRLEDELHEIKWRRNSNIDSYIDEIDMAANRLRIHGEEV